MPLVTEQQTICSDVLDAKKDLFDTDYLQQDLKGRSVRGGVITLFSQGCKFAFQTVSTVVLARLLTPADFGLIAMVTALTSFAMLFKDLGLSMATVQKKEINHAQISTLFWINVAAGLVIAALVAAMAPAVAWFYGQPELKAVTMALGIVFAFGGLAVQHQALLRRHMRFFALGLVEVVSMAVSVAAAIIAGLYGAGYWSLVVLHVAMAVCSVVGVWVAMPWRPGLPRKGCGVREMLGFGTNIAGFNLVNYFARNADNILIGKFVGASALGFYSKAYGLLMLPIRQVRSPLVSVGLPGLSRLQAEPRRYKSYYLKMVQLLAFITMPVAMVLGAYSRQIIMLVLGPQWEQAAPIFSILALVALIQPVKGTDAMVMISAGQTGRYFRLGVVTSITYVASFAVGLPWGARGVALSYTIANYVLLLPTLAYAFNGTPVAVRDFFKAVMVPCIAAVIMVFGSAVVFRLCTRFVDWLALIIALLAAGLVYFAAYLLLPGGRSVLREIMLIPRLMLKPAEQI